MASSQQITQTQIAISRKLVADLAASDNEHIGNVIDRLRTHCPDAASLQEQMDWVKYMILVAGSKNGVRALGKLGIRFDDIDSVSVIENRAEGDRKKRLGSIAEAVTYGLKPVRRSGQTVDFRVVTYAARSCDASDVVKIWNAAADDIPTHNTNGNHSDSRNIILINAALYAQDKTVYARLAHEMGFDTTDPFSLALKLHSTAMDMAPIMFPDGDVPTLVQFRTAIDNSFEHFKQQQEALMKPVEVVPASLPAPKYKFKIR